MTVDELAKAQKDSVENLIERLKDFGMTVEGPETQLTTRQLDIYQDFNERIEHFASVEGISGTWATRLVCAGFLRAEHLLKAELPEIAEALQNRDLQTAWKIKKAVVGIK